MTQSFEYKGQWFLPSNKENRLNGILKFDKDEGSFLELFGSFEEYGFLGSLRSEDIILGITNQSKHITLYKSFVTKSGGATLLSHGESGQPTTIYRVNLILEGTHIDSKENIQFQKINCTINNLDEWLGITGFERTPIPNTNLDTLEINIKYVLPKQISFKINDSLDAKFDFQINHPGWSALQKSINMTQKVEFIISSKDYYSLEELLKNYFIFQNFIVLALYGRTFSSNIKVSNDNIVDNIDNENTIRKEVNVYFATSSSKKERKIKFHPEMIFAYKHIEENFQQIISSWYSKYILLEPVFNLLFEQFYNDERFTENTFLNLAQAAETFHARTDNHTKMPKDEYKTMQEDVLNSTPSKYHEWLKEQFNFGNNLNLQARLVDLVDKYSNSTTDKLIGDKELFIKQVKYSRNYYTHYSTSTAKHALKGTQLLRLTEKLKLLLVCALLIEVGLDSKKLSGLLEERAYIFFNHLFDK